MNPHCTLDEALEQLLAHVVHTTLGYNGAVIGPAHRHLHARLDTSMTQGDYDTLVLELYVDDTGVKTYTLDLTDARFKPTGATGVADRRNGYWWRYGQQFYGWEPDAHAIATAVCSIADYHQIPSTDGLLK